MNKCECGGLVPSGLSACPNCAVTVRSGIPMRKVLAIVALAASACGPTAMAVYGVPPCADGGTECYQQQNDAGTKDGGSGDAGTTDGGTSDGGTKDGGDGG